MIRRRVIGDEIEHQPQAAIPEALTDPRQCGVAAQTGMHCVARDRESRAGDVLLAQIGQRLLKLVTPLRVRT
jgi:hypothetical protein